MIKYVDVVRLNSKGKSTISSIYYDGELVCFGLEDEKREVKVKHETRIPEGIYDIIIREHGGFHEKYKSKFAFHKGMLEVANVPNFDSILIHIGNTISDTSGCLLTGNGIRFVGNLFELQDSTGAYEKLYKLVIEDVFKGNVKIRYTSI